MAPGARASIARSAPGGSGKRQLFGSDIQPDHMQAHRLGILDRHVAQPAET